MPRDQIPLKLGNDGVKITLESAGVAEPADARDLKSLARQRACGFDPRLRHQAVVQKWLFKASQEHSCR